jgi:hypothetical protein
MMALTSRSGSTDWQSWPAWKRDRARAIHKAVYDAAVGLTDEEIEVVVQRALNVARRHLSS